MSTKLMNCFRYFAWLIAVLVLAILCQFCKNQNADDASNDGTIEALDVKNGFKDAKFGMPIVAFDGLIPDSDNKPDESHQSYTVSHENGFLGDIPLSLLKYTFYKGKLISIEYRVEGEENMSKLTRALETAYGPGKDAILGAVWEGKNVSMSTMRFEELGSGKKYFRVDMSSQEMYRQNREARIRARQLEDKRNAQDL
ncbi:MAG: hypothetical protein ACRYFX_23735 [Janthinobacterium lividum]